MAEPVTRFQVGRREGGKRLDRFLHERIPGLSRTRIQRAIHERVELSWGVAARPATRVRPGGAVHIGYTPPVETPLDLEIRVLAEGPGWLAVDKPPGLPVHPVNRVRENTVIRMLRRQLDRPDLRLAHRLDRETSGALLLAEDADTARRLSGAFYRGQVHKEYLALVAGDVRDDGGTIDRPIGRDVASAVFVRQRAGVGKPATTRWIVERRLEQRTLVRLFPKTGRRHQLRVHLEDLGHPILGDMLYGRPDSDYLDLVRGAGDPRRLGDGPLRQMLHCRRLRVEDVDVSAPLPADFLDQLAPGSR